jgi:hypothetical protein
MSMEQRVTRLTVRGVEHRNGRVYLAVQKETDYPGTTTTEDLGEIELDTAARDTLIVTLLRPESGAATGPPPFITTPANPLQTRRLLAEGLQEATRRARQMQADHVSPQFEVLTIVVPDAAEILADPREREAAETIARVGRTTRVHLELHVRRNYGNVSLADFGGSAPLRSLALAPSSLHVRYIVAGKVVQAVTP